MEFIARVVMSLLAIFGGTILCYAISELNKRYPIVAVVLLCIIIGLIMIVIIKSVVDYCADYLEFFKKRLNFRRWKKLKNYNGYTVWSDGEFYRVDRIIFGKIEELEAYVDRKM